ELRLPRYHADGVGDGGGGRAHRPHRRPSQARLRRVLRRPPPAPRRPLRRAGGHGRAGRAPLLRPGLLDHRRVHRRRRRLGQVDRVRTLRLLESMRDVARAAWDALVGDGSPFLEWDWLALLEDSGAATAATGWLPRPLTLREGERLVGACPLYVKGHSLGEFVFDQNWAAAAARAGIAYYPKLLVAVPFTPVTGARFLAAPGTERGEVIATLAAALEATCAESHLSSAHVNFCLPDEAAALEARGWLARAGWQYHWTNPGFASFADYLVSLRSKRRNQVRRERRELAAEGVEIVTHVGDGIPDALFPRMFALYRRTIDQLPWGQQYLDERFFTLARGRRVQALARLRPDRDREPALAPRPAPRGGGPALPRPGAARRGARARLARRTERAQTRPRGSGRRRLSPRAPDGVDGGAPKRLGTAMLAALLFAPAALAGETTRTEAVGLRFAVPTAWTRVPAPSDVRAAQWRLPRAAGDAEDGEVILFFFGAGKGGSAAEHLERWYAQLTPADGRPARDAAEGTMRPVR